MSKYKFQVGQRVAFKNTFLVFIIASRYRDVSKVNRYLLKDTVIHFVNPQPIRESELTAIDDVKERHLTQDEQKVMKNALLKSVEIVKEK